MDLEIRELTCEHLNTVSTIHRTAFPDSAMSNLGTEVVRRYYEWLLNGPHDASNFGLFCQDDLLGFCFGGKFNGAVSGFVKRNRLFLVVRVISQPGLLFSAEFRRRIRIGVRALFRSRPRPGLELRTEQAAIQPSFGILAIAVSPQSQGEGVGKRLMQEADRIAAKKGFEKMNLSVGVTNKQAIAFYENLGWERGLEDGVWKGQMTKSLTRGKK